MIRSQDGFCETDQILGYPLPAGMQRFAYLESGPVTKTIRAAAAMLVPPPTFRFRARFRR